MARCSISGSPTKASQSNSSLVRRFTRRTTHHRSIAGPTSGRRGKGSSHSQVCQRLQVGQVVNCAACVGDNDLVADTESELTAEYRVMASIDRAKHIRVVSGSTEQEIVVGEPCRYRVATAVKEVVSVAAVELVVPKLPVEKIVSLVGKDESAAGRNWDCICASTPPRTSPRPAGAWSAR